MEVACPYCGEVTSFDVSEDYKGTLSCPWCPHTCYVEIESGELKLVKKEPPKVSQKSAK